MSLNSSEFYSCFDNTGLNTSFVSVKYWSSEEDNVRSYALASAIFAQLFILIGVPTNLLILVSMLWQRLYRETTYILLLNLTVANLLVCVTVMPFTVVSGFAGGFIFGSNDWTRCKVCQTGIILTCLSLFSLHILALMSIDRWIFIGYPFKYNMIMSKKNVLIAIFVLWILCIIISLFPLFGFGDIHYKFPMATCTLHLDGNTTVTDNRNYGLLIMMENLLIPWPILIITNCLITLTVTRNLKKVYRTKKDLGCSQEELLRKLLKDNEKAKLRKQVHLIKVFGGTLFAHLITSLPTNIYITKAVISGNEDFSPFESTLLFICFLCYPVVHPLMQACLIPEVRKVQANILRYLTDYCRPRSTNTAVSRPTDNQSSYDCTKNECKCQNTEQLWNLICLAALPATNSSKENTNL